jgi:carbon-monoxide dehydrogenase medium subunit
MHASPVLLQTELTRRAPAPPPLRTLPDESIQTTINGRSARFAHVHQKTLLNFLREDAGLTGCKEGCAEGECGACTVWLNGQAVMSCLVPAAQAHGGQITTIEFDASRVHNQPASAPFLDEQAASQEQASSVHAADVDEGRYLQPLQQAFIDCGAVQCGFCIPGMLMAGAKLLEECPHPEMEQMRAALSGNICRCTGYRKILDALIQVGGSNHE